MKILIPIDARLLVNNVEYKGIGTGLFTQLRLASDETTVKSTGTEIETSGVYEFEITGTALTSYLELWICATENGTYTKVKSWGGTNGIRQKEYLVYTALLSQSGTNAPVATILENTLIGTPTWNYLNPASYRATLTGGFTVGKTTISPNNVTFATGDYFTVTGIQANLIEVLTNDNGVLPPFFSIEIRVYP